MFVTTTYESPLGTLRLVADGEELAALWIEAHERQASFERSALTEGADAAVFQSTGDWLDAYFSGREPAVPLPPLSPSGTPFQREVWDILLSIPYGETLTYGDIARTLAARRGIPRMASQAVGGAVGRNPISILIPCHRVVGVNGNLTGYGGGINNKIKLLEIEGTDMSPFHLPAKGTVRE